MTSFRYEGFSYSRMRFETCRETKRRHEDIIVDWNRCVVVGRLVIRMGSDCASRKLR